MASTRHAAALSVFAHEWYIVPPDFIQYEPVVHPEAAAHVHHMILFTCKGIDAELDQLTPEELAGGPCDAPTSPIRRCFTGTTIIAVWAVGGQVTM